MHSLLGYPRRDFDIDSATTGVTDPHMCRGFTERVAEPWGDLHRICALTDWNTRVTARSFGQLHSWRAFCNDLVYGTTVLLPLAQVLGLPDLE